MFPDTHSTPTETRVLMGSIHLRLGTRLLYWLAVLIFGATGLYSLTQMSLLGLNPSASAGDSPVLSAFTSVYEPVRLMLPVTGLADPSVVMHTFVDDFSLDTGDWSALEGSIRIQDGTLILTAGLMGKGGSATWNLPSELVSSSFTYSADIVDAAPAWQRFGLAVNLQPDGSGLLLLIEPDTGKAAVVWRYSQGSTYLVPWQQSPGVLPAPTVNHVEVMCTPSLITLRVNGLDAASLPPPLPCNQGALGVVTLNPALLLSVDNASLQLIEN